MAKKDVCQPSMVDTAQPDVIYEDTQQQDTAISFHSEPLHPSVTSITTPKIRSSPRSRTHNTHTHQTQPVPDCYPAFQKNHNPQPQSQNPQSPHPISKSTQQSKPPPSPPLSNPTQVPVPEAFIKILQRRGWQPSEIDALLNLEAMKSWDLGPTPQPDADISPALKDYQMQLWLLHEMNNRARWADEIRGSLLVELE